MKRSVMYFELADFYRGVSDWKIDSKELAAHRTGGLGFNPAG